MFWIKGVPSYINNSNNEMILQYINRTISSEIPLQSVDKELHNLVIRLQSHSHTSFCMPTQKPPCRFGFPKRECSQTRLLSTVLTLKNKGKFYETKRNGNSLFINSYNPVILRHWRANMDIQMINNAEGAAYYTCHYLCKSEPDELKLALTNLINHVFKQNPTMTAFQRLWNIGTCVLKHSRLSAQEAAFRLSNLKLVQNSRAVVYVNTRRIEKRFEILKPMHEIDRMHDDETDIFLTNIIDYYYSRPGSLEYVCL